MGGKLGVPVVETPQDITDPRGDRLARPLGLVAELSGAAGEPGRLP